MLYCKVLICHSGTFSRRKVCISILVSDNLTSCPLRVYFRVIDQEIDNIGVSKRVYFSECKHYCVYFHHCTSFSKIRIKCIKFGDQYLWYMKLYNNHSKLYNIFKISHVIYYLSNSAR